jgi:hypothetical protein
MNDYAPRDLTIKAAFHSAFIIGSIVASHHLAVSFHWYASPSRITHALVIGPISMSRALNVDLTVGGEGLAIDNSSMIHRYDSPFLASSIADGCRRSSSALIVLNTPIQSLVGFKNTNTRSDGTGCTVLSGSVLGVLWGSSAYRVCADGGANRLYDATVTAMLGGEGGGAVKDAAANCEFLPDLITGDLDSLRPGVRRYYESRGVPILLVEDQNYHDLDVRYCVI